MCNYLTQRIDKIAIMWKENSVKCLTLNLDRTEMCHFGRVQSMPSPVRNKVFGIFVG